MNIILSVIDIPLIVMRYIEETFRTWKITVNKIFEKLHPRQVQYHQLLILGYNLLLVNREDHQGNIFGSYFFLKIQQIFAVQLKWFYPLGAAFSNDDLIGQWCQQKAFLAFIGRYMIESVILLSGFILKHRFSGENFKIGSLAVQLHGVWVPNSELTSNTFSRSTLKLQKNRQTLWT